MLLQRCGQVGASLQLRVGGVLICTPDKARRARVPVLLATIYDTLRQFTETGLPCQFALDGAKAYFDTNPTEHHHLFLEEEGEIVDMPSSGLSVADLPEPLEGLEVAGVEVMVRLRRAKRALS